MVCRTTFTRRSKNGFTLVELMVATLAGSILLAALMYSFFFSNRSFASLTNYLDLDQKTQATLDRMSREIRQVNMLTGFSSTNLTFQDYDLGTLQYQYNPQSQILTRTKSGATTVLLTGCDSLQFSIFQRTPMTNTFQPYSTTVVTNTKVIQLSWNCSRTILGSKANTESMQSAKIVIRKK